MNTTERTAPLAHEVANKTAHLLGGYRNITATVGGHNFAADSGGALIFHFKGSDCANICTVEYRQLSDDYVLRLDKIIVKKKKEISYRAVSMCSGLNPDTLVKAFERETQLSLSL